MIKTKLSLTWYALQITLNKAQIIKYLENYYFLNFITQVTSIKIILIFTLIINIYIKFVNLKKIDENLQIIFNFKKFYFLRKNV